MGALAVFHSRQSVNNRDELQPDAEFCRVLPGPFPFKNFRSNLKSALAFIPFIWIDSSSPNHTDLKAEHDTSRMLSGVASPQQELLETCDHVRARGSVRRGHLYDY